MDNNAAMVWTCEYCGRPLKKKTWYFGACLCRGCAFRDMLEDVFKKILLPVLLVGVAYMIANYLVTVWQITESDRFFYIIGKFAKWRTHDEKSPPGGGHGKQDDV